MQYGVYHSFSEASVMGILWGYHLPIGYLGFALGLLVMAYPKTRLTKKLSFPSLMIAIGFLLIFTNILMPKEFFINLIHQSNSNPALIDIDYPVGNLLVWVLTLFSIMAGAMLRIRGSQLQKVG